MISCRKRGWIATSVAFSPDGRVVLADDSEGPALGALALWDVQTGNPVRRIAAKGMAIFDAQFSPEGSMVVASGYEIRGWRADTGEEVRILVQDLGVRASPMNFALVPTEQVKEISEGLDRVSEEHFRTSANLRFGPNDACHYPGHAGLVGVRWACSLDGQN